MGAAAGAVVAALLLNLLLPPLTAACETSLDCSLQGDCVSGHCHCDSAFAGSPMCDVMAVSVSEHRNGGYRNRTAASWGGNVLWENGKYHLFVAQMTQGCGLQNYGTNSAIVRAESYSAAGPFHLKETVRHPFAHNPTIRRLPNNTGFVIFFIGGNPAKQLDCRSNVTTGAADAAAPPTLVGGSIHAIHATSIQGPWSQPVPIEFDDGGSNTSTWVGGGTNPSPVIEPDGSVTLALQRVLRAEQAKGGDNKELLGVARAPTWRGPYTMITDKPVRPEHLGCIAGTGE